VWIGVRRDSGAVAFTVEDDGPASPDTDREAIFEPGPGPAGPAQPR
jgi:signal transduction histidine kinase